MEKQIVKDMNIQIAERAKRVNIQLVSRDESGGVMDATIMLGRGDELYIEKILELMKVYLMDDTVDRMIEVYAH